MKIFLDDVRKSQDIYPNENDWIIARDIEDIKPFLIKGLVANLSLDGDMGLDDNNKDIPGGYELCIWMEENNKWPTERVYIHSMNPVKRQMMLEIITKHYQ